MNQSLFNLYCPLRDPINLCDKSLALSLVVYEVAKIWCILKYSLAGTEVVMRSLNTLSEVCVTCEKFVIC